VRRGFNRLFAPFAHRTIVFITCNGASVAADPNGVLAPLFALWQFPPLPKRVYIAPGQPACRARRIPLRGERGAASNSGGSLP
jgi:hypothetical protein